jgi:acyl-CoA reductase-like NAD-dependent aldehyde dehydrogenase
MTWREFLGVVVGIAAWPFTVRAQANAMPALLVVGQELCTVGRDRIWHAD